MTPVDLDDFLADQPRPVPDRGSSDPIRPLQPRDPAPIRPTGPRYHGLRAVA